MYQADVVETCVEALTQGRHAWHLVGHGFGGLVAQELLHRSNVQGFTLNSSRLASVTFVNTPFVPTPPTTMLYVVGWRDAVCEQSQARQ